ncbi:glycosyltransferase [Actinomadura madurae]|uniref:glycosyltransferase n=1 Tax=Actinomadura madurae TaxID=1993 RepID=UPI0020D2117F|nr:glycosyltransferase [Actinomadura madurae]MCP9976429.1 glycosyltransferase [Actinomadura madurae]
MFRSPDTAPGIASLLAEKRDAVLHHGREAQARRQDAEEQLRHIQAREELIKEKEREIASIREEIKRMDTAARNASGQADQHTRSQEMAELAVQDLEAVLGQYAPAALELAAAPGAPRRAVRPSTARSRPPPRRPPGRLPPAPRPSRPAATPSSSPATAPAPSSSPRSSRAADMQYAITHAMGPPVLQVDLTCERPTCDTRFELPYDQPMRALNILAHQQGWTLDPALGPVCPAHPAEAPTPAVTLPAPAPAAAVTQPEGIPVVREPAVHRIQHADLRGRWPHDPRRGRPDALAGPAPLTLAVIVPAHNEEEGLPATLESLLRQTVPADQIIVVDDGSTDRTSQVAAAYPGVTVLRPPANLGSKAKAQNYALPYCRTRLVLPVDADTVLADDYIERVKPEFNDPQVAIAAARSAPASRRRSGNGAARSSTSSASTGSAPSSTP